MSSTPARDALDAFLATTPSVYMVQGDDYATETVFDVLHPAHQQYLALEQAAEREQAQAQYDAMPQFLKDFQLGLGRYGSQAVGDAWRSGALVVPVEYQAAASDMLAWQQAHDSTSAWDSWGQTAWLGAMAVISAGAASEFVLPEATASDAASLSAADAAGGLAPEFGTPAAYDAALEAPLASETTVTFPDGLVDVELPAIPDLPPEDLQAIQDAAGAAPATPSMPEGLPEPAPAPGAPDAPLVSSSAIAPPPLLDVALEAPAIAELPLPEITIAAGGGAVLGTLSLPTLTSALTAAKKLLGGGGGATSSAAPAATRAAITPADLNVDPTTGDTWLRPDDTGTVSQTQFAMFATALLALSSVFFIK